MRPHGPMGDRAGRFLNETFNTMRSVLVAVVVALATALHASVWLFLHEKVSPPNASGVLASVSFSPIDPKAADKLASRVHNCWIAPEEATTASTQATTGATTKDGTIPN